MRSKFAATALFRLILAILAAAPLHAADRPNIVFFYADDLGYGDLACYGSPIAQTPVLDQLAREGTRFTRFYVSHCVCSPTRCSAITGHFPARHGIYGHIADFEANDRRQMPHWLDVAAPSFPRALQQAGYRTAMIGKWHLGGGSGRTRAGSDKIVINHPDAPPVAKYGFDHVRITYGNGPTWKNAEPWPEPHEIYPYSDPGWTVWSSHAVADEAIRFLTNHASVSAAAGGPKQPFYANVWFKDVHIPLEPTPEMRAPFSKLEGKAQTHYAMVRYLDSQIGRVLDKLDELGLRENTLVLFSSDNGAAKDRGGSNAPLRGWKHSLYEGGIREPFIVRWPGRVPAGKVDADSALNIVDLVPTLAALTNAEMPKGYKPDGEHIGAALRGQPFKRTKPQFWHYPAASPSLAVQIGNWKLMTDPDGKTEALYDLAADIGETNNLVAKNPGTVADLKRELFAWYREAGLEKLRPLATK